MINKNNNLKEKNLAYGGQALIEGVLMRGKEGYAFTVQQPDGNFYKEKINHIALGKRIKFFGLPFIRGIAGLVESLVIGIKVLNKSAEVAFPEENETKKTSGIAMFFVVVLSFAIAFLIFGAVPYVLTDYLSPFDQNNNPVLYNIASGLIRLIMFFIYLILISFLKDTKRIFGYHGAEHKTIHTYESKKELSLKNVKESSRLHPRCGTSFIFIVFLITILVFPLFNIFFNTQAWYNQLKELGFLGKALQKIVHIISHLVIGMPFVAAISYELLKLSQKFEKNFIIKILISPGLFFQLFTTREPEDAMIKSAIYSLKMILGEEKQATKRSVTDII